MALRGPSREGALSTLHVFRIAQTADLPFD
jgi:hypothetical protein